MMQAMFGRWEDLYGTDKDEQTDKMARGRKQRTGDFRQSNLDGEETKTGANLASNETDENRVETRLAQKGHEKIRN